MNFVLVNPQHTNLSNPENEETSTSQQEKANMIISIQKDMENLDSNYATQG
jgi:hypothetical protein